MSTLTQDEINTMLWKWDVLLQELSLDNASEARLAVTARHAQKDVPRLLAEVQRLRAVERAARNLHKATSRDQRLLCHAYRWDDLAAALDAKQEDSKP